MSIYANEVVVEAYRKYLRRAPDTEGFSFWVNKVIESITAGSSAADIEETLRVAFTDSEEYKTLTTI